MAALPLRKGGLAEQGDVGAAGQTVNHSGMPATQPKAR
ncbi:hypothetical protein DEFR109230_17560 [Deinococcus frigens]